MSSALLERVFPGDGEMAGRMRAVDWAATPLGPVSEWSEALRTTAGLVLHSRLPMVLWWGPELIQLYNDTYIPIPGAKHPKALAQPASECWTEVWPIIGPMIEAPYGGAPATTSDDLELLVDRRGFLEETHFRVAYSPVPDDSVPATRVGGVLATVVETTEQVYAQRTLRTLRELAARAPHARTPEDACRSAAATFAENPRDVPFALFYLLEADGQSARLAASCGFDRAADANRPVVALDDAGAPWPLARVLRGNAALVEDDLRRRFGPLPAGGGATPPRSAILVPLSSPEQGRTDGVLIAGCNPHRALDEAYRAFFELAASQVIAAIRNARAHADQRLRAERLAELDSDRRRGEQALRDSEERYRRLVSVLPAAIHTCDADGRITFYNHHAAALWGRTPRTGEQEDRFCGSWRAWRLDGTRLPADEMPTARAIRRGTPCRDQEVVIERPDGSRITVRVNVDPIRDQHGRLAGAVSVFHDVTASAETERRLRGSETLLGQRAAQFSTLLEHAPVGVYVVDADFRIREVNPIALPVFGDIPDLEGRDFDDVAHDVWEQPHADELVRVFRHTLGTGEPHVAPERGERRRNRGVTEWYEWELHRIPLPDGRFGVVCYLRDISAQVRARDLIATSEERYRSLVSVLTDVPWSTDADGRFAEPQMAWMAYTGQGWDRHRGLGWLDAIHPDDRTTVESVWRESCRTGRPYETRSRIWHGSLHEYRHVVARAIPLRHPDGTIREWVGTCTDVHEAQTKADALADLSDEREALLAVTEQARADAETANRAKDDFLAVLSHELRSPLNAMLGWVELLKHADPHEGLVGRAVATLERNVWTQARVIDDLLDVSRIASGKLVLERSRLDLAGVVAGVVESLRPLAEAKHLELTLAMAAGPLEVHGDDARLEQVVGNLLHNAIKYTDDRGRVAVRVEPSEAWLAVVIEDTGQGIDPEVLPHVFDRFVQSGESTTRRHGGLGLGLAIVKQLAALHGGSVQAESDGTGHGSRFTLSLPRARPRLPALALEGPAAPPRARGDIAGLDVLLVEDDADAREALALAIESRGARVRLAESAREALLQYEARAPDLLVSDIGMPDEDGYSLIRRIREREEVGGRHTLAIAMTGFASRHDHERALRAGFDEHVSKPIRLQDLFERMRVLASSRAASRGW
jgi:hypothetical protein